jgi:hypothetical protein
MTVLVFIKDLLLATLGQMASLFAGLFIFGLMIQFISQFTFKSLAKSFGNGGVYLVAWLGTPLHELGHALFCVIFGHKIQEIKFFQPDPATGTLGYVHHTWNPKNPWHVLGNFFIGVGPVVLGSAVLFVLFYFLIPDSHRLWDSVIVGIGGIEKGTTIGTYLTVFRDAALAIIRLIFTPENPTTWRFWLFLYLSICVASNIRLSWADIKGSLSGLGCIVLLFLLMNLVFLLIGNNGNQFFPFTVSWLGAVYGVLVLALIMVLIGFVLIYLLSSIYYRIRFSSFLNPFI